ncbi:hypothetical protein BU17DRAFT_82056 [Hysterangium stoloniferum]|nr:hypothetical protein BU17DRAFT_82056 [Hysterangium stoloniferum]
MASMPLLSDCINKTNSTGSTSESNRSAVPNDADLWIRRQSARREPEAAHAALTPTIDTLLDGFNAMDVNTSMANTQAASASISVPNLAPTPRPQKPLLRRFNAKKSHAAPNRPSTRTFSNSSSSTSSESSSVDSGLSRCSSYSTIASSVPATPEALECELPRVGGSDSESEGPSSEGDDADPFLRQLPPPHQYRTAHSGGAGVLTKSSIHMSAQTAELGGGGGNAPRDFGADCKHDNGAQESPHPWNDGQCVHQFLLQPLCIVP